MLIEKGKSIEKIRENDWHPITKSTSDIAIEWCFVTSRLRVKRKDDLAWIYSSRSMDSHSAINYGEKMFDRARRILLTGRVMVADYLYLDNGDIVKL